MVTVQLKNGMKLSIKASSYYEAVEKILAKMPSLKREEIIYPKN